MKSFDQTNHLVNKYSNFAPNESRLEWKRRKTKSSLTQITRVHSHFVLDSLSASHKPECECSEFVMIVLFSLYLSRGRFSFEIGFFKLPQPQHIRPPKEMRRESEGLCYRYGFDTEMQFSGWSRFGRSHGEKTTNRIVFAHFT